MKKIFLFILITLLSFWQVCSAEENDTIMVEVTEPIPGLNCIGKTNWESGSSESCSVENDKCIIKCPVKKWVGSFTDILGTIIRYITFLVWLAWVLYIIINGILYSMGWVEQGMKDEAKKRIVQGLIGIVLLLLSGFILNLIAPWVYTAP